VQIESLCGAGLQTARIAAFVCWTAIRNPSAQRLAFVIMAP
jgi:hypothetical protein